MAANFAGELGEHFVAAIGADAKITALGDKHHLALEMNQFFLTHVDLFLPVIAVMTKWAGRERADT